MKQCALVAGILLVLGCGQRDEATSSVDAPLVEEFRATERQCITAFNDLLVRQRANAIDELAMAPALETTVIQPWRAIHVRIEALSDIPISRIWLYEMLRRYARARETSWEAFEAGLRSQSDAAARPHYDAYHALDADADLYARQLGHLFRAMTQ